MKKPNINVVALALACAFSAGTMAQSLSNDDYKAGKNKIAVDYKVAAANCASWSGNPYDICVAEAQGGRKSAEAELNAAYKPSRENRHQVLVAKAEAVYAVARERCDDRAGNAKDVCVKEAKAVQTTAKADAKAQMKTATANDTANEKSADARKDATADKREAQHALAKEKCDTYAGGAKDHCLAEVKARFDKPS